MPFHDDDHLTREQKRFNHRLSFARIIIERSIGLLKGRYLLDKLPVTRTNLIPYIITCCILHNICLLQYVEIPVIIPEILQILKWNR